MIHLVKTDCFCGLGTDDSVIGRAGIALLIQLLLHTHDYKYIIVSPGKGVGFQS